VRVYVSPFAGSVVCVRVSECVCPCMRACMRVCVCALERIQMCILLF